MDDPWGSHAEPWAAKAPEDDPMRPPASFLMPEDLSVQDSTPGLPRIQRKASAASDPWGHSNTEVQAEDEDWSGKVGAEVQAPAPPSQATEGATAGSSWMVEEDINAWDKPAHATPGAVDDDRSNGEEPANALEAQSKAIGSPDASSPHPTMVDLGSPPLRASTFDSGGFGAEDADYATVPLPRVDSDAPILRVPSGINLDLAEPDENPFGQVEPSSPLESPIRTRLSTPPIESNLGISQTLSSPRFSDGGFGGFADPTVGAEDSWGSPQVPQDSWGQMELSSPGLGGGSMEQDEDGEVDAWGSSVRPRKPFDDEASAPSTARTVAPDVVQDWDAARREAERREARAPSELVAKLEKAWPSLVMQAFNLVEQDGKSRGADKEDIPTLDPATVAKRDRLMSEMSARPSTLDYLVPYSSTQTYARASTALSQLPINPDTSFLAQAERRSERSGGTTIDQLEKEWNTRSMLGEPENEVKQANLASPADSRRPGWNLFGRKASQQGVPLTTSGGGLLQIKAMEPTPVGSRASGEAPRTTQSEGNAMSSLPVATAIVSKSASAVTAPVSSRPASPAAPASAALQDPAAEPGASAVGRFFGRFRKKAASPSVDLSNQDLQLSTDDFSFLDQVPAAPSALHPAENGTADLLGGSSGAQDNMDSLEAMLNGSAQRPPITLGVVPVGKRGSSKQVPKVGLPPPPPPPRPSAMDLFGDLDFSGDGRIEPIQQSSGRAPAAPSAPTTSWDDFLRAPTSPAKKASAPIAPQKDLQSLGNARKETSLSPLQSISSQTLPGPQAPLPQEDDGFGDFGSFDQALPSSDRPQADSFDDFGDFFATTTKHVPVRASARISGPSARDQATLSTLSVQQVSRAAPATQSDAALHGRWPGPRSPIPPLLAPPPAGAPKTGSFDFFSSDSGPPTGISLLPPPPGTSRPPSRTPSAPLAAPMPVHAPPAQNSKAGLSAQDLSFFDSL